MTINVDNSLECKYRQGDSITVANLKGAQKFVEEEAKRLNPTYLMRSWNSISNNSLIIGILGAVDGAILTWVLTK